MSNRDERYDAWLTPTQWRAEQRRREKERAQLAKVGLDVVAQAAPAIAPVVYDVGRRGAAAVRTGRAAISRAAATRVAVGVGTASVGIGTAAALAIVAGAASYFGTKWMIDRYGAAGRRMRRDDQAAAAATAYREARRDAAKKLGRDLTVAENQELGRQFKAQLAKLGWQS